MLGIQCQTICCCLLPVPIGAKLKLFTPKYKTYAKPKPKDRIFPMTTLAVFWTVSVVTVKSLKTKNICISSSFPLVYVSILIRNFFSLLHHSLRTTLLHLKPATVAVTIGCVFKCIAYFWCCIYIYLSNSCWPLQFAVGIPFLFLCPWMMLLHDAVLHFF